jgi:hypothetical protein
MNRRQLAHAIQQRWRRRRDLVWSHCRSNNRPTRLRLCLERQAGPSRPAGVVARYSGGRRAGAGQLDGAGQARVPGGVLRCLQTDPLLARRSQEREVLVASGGVYLPMIERRQGAAGHLEAPFRPLRV